MTYGSSKGRRKHARMVGYKTWHTAFYQWFEREWAHRADPPLPGSAVYESMRLAFEAGYEARGSKR